MSRQLHPLRAQRWAFSDLNPWLAWLGPAAQAVKAQRQAVAADNPARKIEKMVSEGVSASLDYYRETRDATSEAAFFQTYGNVFSLYLADKHEADLHAAEIAAEPRDLPFVKEALASIEEGGFAEALARVGALLAKRGAPLPLARLALKQELTVEYRDLLPNVAPDQWRRIRGEQDIIVRYEPEKAIAALPKLLSKQGDRDRLVTLVRRLLADERMRRFEPTTEQLAMVENIGETLDVTPAPRRRGSPARKAKRAPGNEAAREKMMPRAETGTRMERKHEKYDRLLDFCKTLPPTPTAVAHPCDESSLASAVEAAKMGLITPILVGPRARIEAVAKEKHLDITSFEIVDAAHSNESAAKAVALVREGRAEALMKGSLHTDELMGEVVKRDTGLRTARRVSHCFIMDVPTYAETLIVTDAAVNIAPSLADKVDIIQNAIDLAPCSTLSRGARAPFYRRWRRSIRRCPRRSRLPRCARWPIAGRSPVRSSTAHSRSTTRSAWSPSRSRRSTHRSRVAPMSSSCRTSKPAICSPRACRSSRRLMPPASSSARVCRSSSRAAPIQ